MICLSIFLTICLSVSVSDYSYFCAFLLLLSFFLSVIIHLTNMYISQCNFKSEFLQQRVGILQLSIFLSFCLHISLFCRPITSLFRPVTIDWESVQQKMIKNFIEYVHPSNSISIYISLSLSVSVSVCLCLCLSLSLSVSVSLFLSVSLSLFLSFSFLLKTL